MIRLLRAIRQLAPWQQIIVAAMAILILATWLAACLVVVSIIGP